MSKKDNTKKFDSPSVTHKISRLSKTSSSEIRVQIFEYQDREVFDLRRFYKTAKMDDFAPTPKGLTVPIEELPSLYRAVRKAFKKAKEEGLIEE